MSNSKDYQNARGHFNKWQQDLKEFILRESSNLMHSYRYYYSQEPEFIKQLEHFAHQVVDQLEPLVNENNLDCNLPKVEHYNAFGERDDKVIHHPSYTAAGDLIYGSGLMHYLLKPGQMLKTLSLFLLSSHAGEAGHNCPIACSAGIIRVLNNYSELEQTQFYLDKLSQPSFSSNFTGAQFLTEIQGGSDVGANATQAFQASDKLWRIKGEKWFCSNANADLILATARFDENSTGTKGLGLFLISKKLPNGQANHYKLRRLKQKIGTRSMATAEIDFEEAIAHPMGELQQGIHLALENVLHLSRIFNAFSVLGMARRAQQIAYFYAQNRPAFKHKIIEYPLVKESLAQIKAENTAMLASIFHMASCQDKLDAIAYEQQPKKQQLLMRTLANLNKYFTAKRSVENIHHCIDILAGNGTIENFSSLPRLLRDAIVCENWEGTHFTLWMQTLRDIVKFQVDELFLAHLSELLSELADDFLYKSIIKDKIDELSSQIKTMKTLSPALQTLHLKEIVEQMAIVNAALALGLEIQKNNAPKTKVAALSLFISRYFHKKNRKDENYLVLIDEVLGIAV
jgi:alkylation response protein AidB-like acyl-CoA dehydrogenase